MLQQSLAVVANPGEDASRAAAVTLAHRQAAIEQSRSPAGTRTGDEQISVERAGGRCRGEPVGHLVVDRRRRLGPKAMEAVPHIAQSGPQDQLAALGYQPKGLVWGSLLLARSQCERRGRRQVAVTDIRDVGPSSNAIPAE